MSATPGPCVRVRCQKCENCLKDEDCGKCKPCKENKKSSTTGKPGRPPRKSPSKSSSPTQKKQPRKQCAKRVCLQLQLPSSAVCAICKGNPKGKLLMECTSCNKVTHPKCNSSNVCGIIKSDENSYWVCPKCCKAQCTNLCDDPCPYSGRHHEMIVTLVQSNSVSANDDRSKLKPFKDCVEKHIRQGWNCDGESVPDESPKLRYPLMHLAVLFGKVQVIDWLLQHGFQSQHTCKDQNPGPGSPLHLAVTHLEVGVRNQSVVKESLTKHFGEIVNLFLLQRSSVFTYKHPPNQDTFFHFLAQHCLENSEGLAKDYLLASLEKLRQYRTNVKVINVKEVLCAQNAKGNTFLHLIVQNDSLHDIVKYLATNFDREFKLLSGTKNKTDDTPREIAAEKGCVKVCEALGAPAALLKIIAQGNSTDSKKENELKPVVKKESEGKRKKLKEEQDELFVKRKKVDEAEKETSSCSSKKQLGTDTTNSEVVHCSESKMQVAETSREETQSNSTKQVNQSSNSKETEDTSGRFENQSIESSPDSSNKTKNQLSRSSKRKLSDSSSQTKKKPSQPSQSKQYLNNDEEDQPWSGECMEEGTQTSTRVSKSLLNYSEIKTSDGHSTRDQNRNDNVTEAINQEHFDESGKNEGSCNKENMTKQECVDKSGKNKSSCNKENAYSTEKAEQSEQRKNGDKPAEARIKLCKIEVDDDSGSTGGTVQTAKYRQEECQISVQSTTVGKNTVANGSFPQISDKHTVFCPEDCTVKHSKVLLALHKCNNNPHNKHNNIPIFMQTLDEYLHKEGRSVASRPIPDKVREFRHPIVHWVAVLGKYQLLSCLAKRKDFNLSVSNPHCDNETAIHRTVLFLEEALTRADRAVSMKRIFDIFSKIVDVFVSEASDVFGRQNSDGDTPFHAVAKAIVEVGQNRQLKCYDKFFKIMLEKLSQMAKKSQPEFEKVKEVLGKTNKEGETFLHVLTCRVGIGHELVNFTFAVLPEEILNQLKKVETRYGKSASAIAADLGSYKLAALLATKNTPIKSPVASEMPRGSRAERASRREESRIAHWIEKNFAFEKGLSGNDATENTAGDEVPDDMSPVFPPKMKSSKGTSSPGEPAPVRKQMFNSSSYHEASSPLSYSSGEVWSPGCIDMEDEDTCVLGELPDAIERPEEHSVANPEDADLPGEPANSKHQLAEPQSPRDVIAVVGVKSEADAPSSVEAVVSDAGRGPAEIETKSEQNVNTDGEWQVTSTSVRTDNMPTLLPGPSTSQCNSMETKQIPKPSSTSQMASATAEPTPSESSTNTTVKPTRPQPVSSGPRTKACIISGIMRSPHTPQVKQSIVKSLRSQFKSTLENTEKLLEEEQAQLAAIRKTCLDAEEKKNELFRQIDELDSTIAKAKEDESKCLYLCKSKQKECEDFKFELEKCETSLQELASLI